MSDNSDNARDLRNDLAKARDAWLESSEGRICCSGYPGGEYLRNRLVAAFIAGWNARSGTERTTE